MLDYGLCCPPPDLEAASMDVLTTPLMSRVDCTSMPVSYLFMMSLIDRVTEVLLTWGFKAELGYGLSLAVNEPSCFASSMLSFGMIG
jgi:hypothetical protein